MTNTDSPLDRLRSKLEKILHLNGCQQRTAGYNDYIEKKDIDTDDMERLEALTLDEVMAEVELYSIAISHKQVIEARIDQVHKDLGGLPLTMPIKSMRNRNTAFKRYGVKMFNTKIKERREAQLAKLRKTL